MPDEDNEDAVEEKRERPIDRPASTTTFPNFASFLTEMHTPRVILLTLALQDADDSVLEDTDAIALSVYSALCPSAPCTLGLALEDIAVLDVAGSAVRVVISSPGPTLRKIRAVLESELGDDSGPLRTDTLGGVLPQQSSVELSSLPNADEREAWRMAAKQGTARQMIHGVEMMRNVATNRQAFGKAIDANETQDWVDPNKQWVAERSDVKVDLISKEDASPANVCICLLALVFLLVTVFDVALERVSVWLFPPEYGVDAVHEIASAEEHLDLVGSRRQQFVTIRVTIAFSKPFIAQSTVAASLMYMAHTRARELTQGFGDPSPALRVSMIGLTGNIIALTALAAAHAWHQHKDSISHRKEKTPQHVMILTLMGVASAFNLVFYLTMLGGILYMDPAICMAEPQLAAAIWGKDRPPDFSPEHRLCLQLCAQYILVNVLALCVMAREVQKTAGQEEGNDEEDPDPGSSRVELVQQKARAGLRNMTSSLDKFRMLHKCVHLAGYVSVLTLILKEVVVDEDSNAAALREALLQIVSWVMVGYTLFTTAMLFCPPWFGLKFEFPEYVVPLGSGLDYLIATSEVPWVSFFFMLVRRSVLLTMYTIITILCCSVFFGDNTSEGAFIMPKIAWPVVWALVVMQMSVVFKVILLVHETMMSSSSWYQMQQGNASQDLHRNERNQMLTLESAVREVECFIGLCPMISCLFITALGRAKELDPMGEVQPFQLTAMNLTAQTMLGQMSLAVIEAAVRRLVFVDYRAVKAEQRKEGLGWGVATERTYSRQRDAEEANVHYPDVTPPPSLGSLREMSHDAFRAIGDPVRRQQSSTSGPKERTPDSEEWPMHHEGHYLCTRCGKMLGTVTQAALLLTQCQAVVAVIVGTVTIDSPYSKRMEDSTNHEDWMSDLMPLLPRNAPMSSALECTLWFTGVYYMMNAIITTCMALYHFGQKGSRWFILAFARAGELCETVPNVCVLYITARILAAQLHGVNSAPPVWMQRQMFVVFIGFIIELVSSMLAPGVMAELWKIGKAVPGIRTTFFVVESMAAVAMYQGIFGLVIGMIIMKPEHIVLPDGRTDIPWRGEGSEPSLQAVSWNMWALTILVFVPAFLHKITQAILTLIKLRLSTARDVRRKVMDAIERGGTGLRRNAKLHHALTLVRETVMSAIILGILFIPMVELKSLATKEGGSKNKLLVSLLNAGFFVASLLLTLKTLLVFFFGFLEKYTEAEIFPGAVESMEDVDQKDEQEAGPAGVEYQNFSNSWQTQVDFKSPKAAVLSRLLKRLCIFITVMEFVASVLLFLGMNHLSKDWENNVVGKETFYFGPAVMFISYVLVYYLTFLMLLFGRHSMFLDQLFDTVVMCPLLIILAVGTRLRSLEVAGAEGVVPSWIRQIMNACAICILTELVMVWILLPLPMRRFWNTGSCIHKSVTDDFLLSRNENTQRVLAVFGKTIIRLTLYGCIGCMVVSLFWMTEDQCLPNRT